MVAGHEILRVADGFCYEQLPSGSDRSFGLRRKVEKRVSVSDRIPRTALARRSRMSGDVCERVNSWRQRPAVRVLAEPITGLSVPIRCPTLRNSRP